jgi:FkbM family methyltransferase
VNRGDVVLDVGANVGAFALRVATSCDGDVTLVCFEPCPDTYRSLRANFARNPALRATRHAVHAIGLGSSAQAGGELAFYNFRRFPTNSTFDVQNKRREIEIFFEDRGERLQRGVEERVPGRAGETIGRALARAVSWLPKGAVGWWVSRQVMGVEEVTAKVETLDGFLKREHVTRVDLLKIDVEGSELDVLEGLGVETWPRVMQVVVETHDRDGRLARICELLRGSGLADIRIARQTTVDNGLDSIILLARRAGSPQREEPPGETRRGP